MHIHFSLTLKFISSYTLVVYPINKYSEETKKDKPYKACLKMDGEGFEPSKQICSGFTVRPLWPLGNPSIYYEFANANSQNKIT